MSDTNKKFITDSIIKDSTGWDEAGDYGDLQLYDGILQIDTVKFKKGDKISCASFMFTQSICQLHQPKGKMKDGFQATEMIEEFPIGLVAQILKA